MTHMHDIQQVPKWTSDGLTSIESSPNVDRPETQRSRVFDIGHVGALAHVTDGQLAVRHTRRETSNGRLYS